MYGVHAKPNEDVEDVVKRNIALFLNRPTAEEEARKMLFVNVHRLPRRHDATQDGDQAPDPIIIRFVKFSEREMVLRAFYTYNSNAAKNRRRQIQEGAATRSADQRTVDKDDPLFRVSIRTDLPRQMKIKRSQLASKAYELRKQGFLTRIRVIGTEVILQTKKANGAEDWKKYTEQ